LTEALAQTGQWDQAEQIARGITDPYVQVSAFLGIATSLTDATPSDSLERDGSLQVRACRLIAETMAGEHWRDAIEILGKLDPSAIVAIYEALHAFNVDQGDSLLKSTEVARYSNRA
jgi:hypothetical protein